jgi:hypothetical protein
LPRGHTAGQRAILGECRQCAEHGFVVDAQDNDPVIAADFFDGGPGGSARINTGVATIEPYHTRIGHSNLLAQAIELTLHARCGYRARYRELEHKDCIDDPMPLAAHVLPQQPAGHQSSPVVIKPKKRRSRDGDVDCNYRDTDLAERLDNHVICPCVGVKNHCEVDLGGNKCIDIGNRRIAVAPVVSQQQFNPSDLGSADHTRTHSRRKG